MVLFQDLKSDYKNLQSEIDGAISSVLKSGSYILGCEVQKLEEEFAEYCGTKYAMGVASGTEALQVALMACGVGYGDEVVTVPNTAVPTISAMSAVGAKPVFVDIDACYYTMNPDLLEKAITEKTKAIVPVHLYGQVVNLKLIMDIAKKYDIPVIEDACQAHGALFYENGKVKKAGSVGCCGCFSFYPTKNLGAYGDAGMIVTDDASLSEKVKQIRNYGQETRYSHKIIGINSRLDEIQAAVLRVKLRKLNENNEIRRKKANLYPKFLGSCDLELPNEAEYAKHVWHLYVVRVPDRSALQKYLFDHEIQTLIHYPTPVHLQKAYSYLNYQEGSFPVCEKISKEVLSLPLYSGIDEKDIEIVCEKIKSFLC